MIEWRPVVGFEGRYEVSSEGTVWSVRGPAPKLLKPTLNPSGHLMVTLYKDGTKSVRYIHQLICEAFHGPRPPGLFALHNNGKAGENNKDNLRWGTRKDNTQDSIRHGTFAKGERAGGAKLSDLDVAAIRATLDAGISLRKTAKLFGISADYVFDLKHYKARREATT